MPSAQIRYQSGCEAADTWEALYGPMLQTGLIWNTPAMIAQTPVTSAKNAPPLSAKVGMIRTPTTLFSLRRTPGNWVCFWYQTSARCTATRPSMMPGITSTCSTYRRGMISVPGNSPPNSAQCSQVPSTGIESTMPDRVARIPVPESRSSGSE